MKYIKTYEKNKSLERYWKVRMGVPYFEISLEKIGVPYSRFAYLNYGSKDFQKGYDVNGRTKHILILIDNESSSGWGWNLVEDGVDKDQIYMGEVEVTEEDIEMWKLKNDANKYNV